MYYSSSPSPYTSSYTSSFTPSYTTSYTTPTTTTPYVTRETYTEITVPTTTNASVSPSYEPLSQPTLSWENFVLINIELDRMASQIQQLQSANEALKATVGREAAISTENNQLKQEVTKVNAQIVDLQTEIKKIPELESRLAQLSTQLNEKTKESDNWKLKYDEMNKTASRYSNLHENIRKENEKTNAELQKAEKVASEFQALKVQSAQLSSQLTALTQTRDKLNTIITDKEKEIKGLKSQVKLMEDLKAELKQTEQGKMVLEGLWEDTKSLIDQLRKEVTDLITELSQGEDGYLREDEDEIEGFKNAIGKLQDAKKIVDSLFEEKNELTKSLEGKEAELTQSKNENKRLLKQNEEKQKEVEHLKAQASMLVDEVNQSQQEYKRLESLLSDITMQKDMLEVQLNDLVERVKLRGSKDAYREKKEQLEREREENELKIKEKRIETAQKKLNQLATEKSRLAVTNMILGDNITDMTKKRGISRANTLLGNSFVASRTSVTPKSSRAMFGSPEKKGFSEYLLEEEPREQTPLPNESAREISNEKMTTIYHIAVEKDKQINTLTQKIVKYEQQIKELNDQRIKALSDNARLRENIKSDLSKSLKDASIEHDAENLALEKMKKMEETILKVREIEVELSAIILQAKTFILNSENEEINKTLGKKIYAMDDWKAKFMELDRIFTSLKEKTKEGLTRDDSKASLKVSHFVLPGFSSPKSSDKDKLQGNVPHLCVSIEALVNSQDASPQLNSKEC